MALTWQVQSAMLFGSQARSDAHIGGGTNLAIFLQGTPGDFVATKLAMPTVLLECGIRIEPMPILQSEWAHPEEHSNPRLLENIGHEGLTL